MFCQVYLKLLGCMNHLFHNKRSRDILIRKQIKVNKSCDCDIGHYTLPKLKIVYWLLSLVAPKIKSLLFVFFLNLFDSIIFATSELQIFRFGIRSQNSTKQVPSIASCCCDAYNKHGGDNPTFEFTPTPEKGGMGDGKRSKTGWEIP